MNAPTQRKARRRRRASELVLMGSVNGSKPTAVETLKQQAAWLARRVSMSPALAMAVAELAF